MRARFIVLVDFSSYSRFELLLARHWADSMGAELLLVHHPVIYAPALSDTVTRDEIIQSEIQEVSAKLRAFAAQVLPDTQRITYHVAVESLVPAVSNLLHSHYYHILFVGLKGTGFLKKIFLGSTAIDVIDHVNQVVAAVPKHPFNMSPDTFYLATSYRYPVNIAELDKLLALFGHRIKHIRFITVITQKDQAKPAAEYVASLTRHYRNTRQTSCETFEGSDAFYALKQYMNTHADGLLVVQKGSRSLTDRVFRKFLINELVYDAATPLIILPV